MFKTPANIAQANEMREILMGEISAISVQLTPDESRDVDSPDYLMWRSRARSALQHKQNQLASVMAYISTKGVSSIEEQLDNIVKLAAAYVAADPGMSEGDVATSSVYLMREILSRYTED